MRAGRPLPWVFFPPIMTLKESEIVEMEVPDDGEWNSHYS